MLLHVQDHLRVLDDVNPVAERYTIILPGVDDVRVGYPRLGRLPVQHIEQELDGRGHVSLAEREYSREQVVYKLRRGEG